MLKLRNAVKWGKMSIISKFSDKEKVAVDQIKSHGGLDVVWRALPSLLSSPISCSVPVLVLNHKNGRKAIEDQAKRSPFPASYYPHCSTSSL